MKALSLHQPWAELILLGRKTIETRTWRTAHRGPFAIRAAFQVETEVCDLYGIDPGSLVTSALVGTAEIVEMIEFDAASWEATRGEHLVPDPDPRGRVGWRLANPRRLAKPIPLRGLPGLFPLEEEVAAQIVHE
jgi:hypothetical protein